jgi:hypothetical protein
MEGKSMLFDPFIRGNSLASGVKMSEVDCDVLLISHAHSDHVGDALEIIEQCEPKVYAIWEICQWLGKHGAGNCHPMNIGGTVNHEGIIGIQLVKAEHSSSFEDGTYGGLAGGYILNIGDKTLYYAGDTALFSDMALYKNRKSIDVAFLPIGGNFTMDIQDALTCALLLDVKTVIGMHYDTFGYIVIAKDAAVELFAQNGIELILMEIGSNKEI